MESLFKRRIGEDVTGFSLKKKAQTELRIKTRAKCLLSPHPSVIGLEAIRTSLRMASQ